MSNPTPMRVAIDAGPLYGHRTGVGVAVERLLAEFESEPRVSAEPYVVSGRAQPQPGHRRLPLPGILASHLWSRTSFPRADRWLGPATIVHGTNYVAPPTQLPTVISVYDCWFLARPELARPLVSRAGNQLKRAVARGATVHASSHATAQLARDLLDTDRVEVIYLGPTAPAAAAAPEQSPVSMRPLHGRAFILAVGTEERRKGIPALVNEFAEVAAVTADVMLAIAGAPSDDSAAIRAAIEQLPPAVQPRIIRLGPVSDDEKRWLLHSAAVVAYPSLDEGFGFPILEAQQYRVPLVATPVGSIPEVAGDGALLAATGDGQFAAALIAALGDTDKRQQLIAAGESNLQRFSWRETAQQMVALYQRLT